MKRKIAVILAADIAGYSRLIAEDEEETLRRFETYRTVFAEFVARGGGRIFNTAGDAILAEFESAVEAVRCAVDIQESLLARNLAYPPSRHMSFRIGITIGDVVERENGDLMGDGVNIAARLESVAPPGGVCVSRSVHEAVATKMGMTFADAGPQTLKNIPEQIHAFTLALDDRDGPVASSPDDPGQQAPPSRTAADRQSRMISAGLAVLALAMVGAYAYEYLPRSVLETLGIVSAAEEVEAGTTSAAPIAQESSPETEPGTVAANSPVEDGPALRVSEPDPSQSTAASIEKEVGDAIAKLEGRQDAERSRINPLTSRYVLTRQWKDCNESTEADTAATACKDLIDTGGWTEDDQAIIHYKYARALRDRGEPDQAIENYTRAIDIKPSSEAYQHRAIAYYDKGDYARAIADFDEAVKLEPKSADAFNNRAWTYYKAGNSDRALKDANRAVNLDASKAYIWDTRGHIHEERGSRTAAIRDYRKALALDAGSESSREGLERLGAAP